MTSHVPEAPATWDRTLPAPVGLLTTEANKAHNSGSSSLLQHHTRSSSFLTPAACETQRRNTMPFLKEALTEEADGGNDTKVSRNESTKETDPLAEADAMSSYDSKPSISTTSDEDRSCSPSSDDRGEVSSGICLCQPEPKIPRPRNAFILYRQHHHVEVVAQHPGLPNPEISKIIGEQWQRLSVHDKAEWKALAEQEKARHLKQYPKYRYKPKRIGRPDDNNLNKSQNTAVNKSSTCPKCGGRTMNPPQTPRYSNFDNANVPASSPRGQKRPYVEGSHVSPRSPFMYGGRPPPSPLVRYGHGLANPPRHEPGGYHIVPADPSVMEHPDVKRRRSSLAPYYPYHGRNEQHAYRHRESVYGPYNAEKSPVGGLGSPAGYHANHVSGGPPRPQQIYVPGAPRPRRELSLTLPPLKTTSAPAKATVSAHGTPQRANIESTIMSYAILDKLRTLNSITPAFAANKVTSPPGDVRGAVIAVEGLDRINVALMTSSLAQYLEKEGDFAVRIFNGPDPYAALEASRRVSEGQQEEVMTTLKYLSCISEWHKISTEAVKYITTRRDLEENISSDRRHEPEGRSSQTPTRTTTGGFNSAALFSPGNRRISPISDVSPGTIAQTAALSLRNESTKKDEGLVGASPPTTHMVTRSSRIPPAVQSAADADSDNIAAEVETVSDDCAISTHSTGQSSSTSKVRIPIAIVPHYQLTTVDTCSVALPITDNYDAITHWRWHATLWRGCVGPDVTVVIRSPPSIPEEDGKGNSEAVSRGAVTPKRASETSQNPAGPPQAQSFGVEVRLQDYRAVIVRTTGPGGRVNGGASIDSTVSSVSASEHEKERDDENWEKAKRRVGFEIAEFLRR